MAIFWPKMAFCHLKWQYLSTEAKNWKSKAILLSSTLKQIILISAPKFQNHNLSSSTLKDLAIKCTYFQYIWLISWDIAVFMIWAQTSLNSVFCWLVGQSVSTQMSNQANSYLSGEIRHLISDTSNYRPLKNSISKHQAFQQYKEPLIIINGEQTDMA